MHPAARRCREKKGGRRRAALRGLRAVRTKGSPRRARNQQADTGLERPCVGDFRREFLPKVAFFSVGTRRGASPPVRKNKRKVKGVEATGAAGVPERL
jgi:hypothetical protein